MDRIGPPPLKAVDLKNQSQVTLTSSEEPRKHPSPGPRRALLRNLTPENYS